MGLGLELEYWLLRNNECLGLNLNHFLGVIDACSWWFTFRVGVRGGVELMVRVEAWKSQQ